MTSKPKLRFVLGNCSLRCSRLWRRASPYLVHLWTRTSCIPAVVIGFPPKLALHPGRSTLNHSCGYASAVDRPACFASSTGIPDPFMQYAG